MLSSKQIKKFKTKEDQEYYTTKDIVIPAGSRIENWCNKSKENGDFLLLFGIGNDFAMDIKITPSELEEMVVCNPEFLTTEKPET